MGSNLHGSGADRPVRKRRIQRTKNALEPVSLVLPETTGANAAILIGVAESADGVATVYTGTAKVSAVLVQSFSLHGEPVAQPRHRVGKFGAYISKDHPIRRFKRRVEEFLSQTWKSGHLDSVVIAVEFMIARPQDVKPTVVMRNRQPDVDNYCKSVLDAISGVAYKNDGVVCGLLSFKRYCVGEESVATTARIYWVMEQ